MYSILYNIFVKNPKTSLPIKLFILFRKIKSITINIVYIYILTIK